MDLDMSDAFDEENLDTFSIIRQAETLVLGRTVITPTTITGVYGVVTAVGKNDLALLPASSQFTRGISVVTQTYMHSADAGFQPDLIAWNGSQYKVLHVDPYGHVGSGFWQIIAQSITSQEPN